MVEHHIEEQVRKILVNEKSYPEPADCLKFDENNLVVYAQDDYKNNLELFNVSTKQGLLAHSSKCAEKSLQEKIWTDEVSEGRPEFVIINSSTNLAIVATLKVPDMSEIPQWVNNTKIQDLTHLDEPLITQDTISPKSYEIFEFSKLFKYAKEERHDKITSVNLVSALTKNNGIKGVVNTNSYIDGNKLTITSNGIYTGTAFYQEKPFVTQDSIAIELIDHELNKYIAMYLICLINNEKIRFNYGRKSSKTKLEQLRLKLPVVMPNQPDWEYMENYIKSLPYSKNI